MPNTYCYVIDPNELDYFGFAPWVVYADRPGRHTISGVENAPGHWGATWEEAQVICRVRNSELGLTEQDVAHILESSRKAGEQGR